MAFHPELVNNELAVMAEMLALDRVFDILELGCGNARLAQNLLLAYPQCRYIGMEVDERQHALNLLNPPPGMAFKAGGAAACRQLRLGDHAQVSASRTHARDESVTE